jgi:hypothetical protein
VGDAWEIRWVDGNQRPPPMVLIGSDDLGTRGPPRYLWVPVTLQHEVAQAPQRVGTQRVWGGRKWKEAATGQSRLDSGQQPQQAGTTDA